MSNSPLENKQRSFWVVAGRWLTVAVLIAAGAYLFQWTALGKAERLFPTGFFRPWDSMVVYVKVINDESDPVLIEERLRLKRGLGALSFNLPIRGRQTLEERVRIVSPQAALQYARLFTSPATAYLMENDDWREIISASAANHDYLFGRDKKILGVSEESIKSVDEAMRVSMKNDEYRASPNGYVTGEEWKDNHLRAPEVVKTKNGYLVRRELFHISQEGPVTNTICWVEEAITPQGGLKSKILTETESNVDFMILSSRETH
jgi:hypothetical protein